MAEETTQTEATTDNTEQAAPESTILSQGAATDTAAEVTDEGTDKTLLSPEDKAKEEGADTEVKPEEEPPAKDEPIVYEAFKLPEGFQLDQPMQDKVLPLFSKYKIDQAGAQEIVDAYSEIQKQQYETAQAEQKKTLDATVDAWKTEIKSDPKYKENIALAQKGAQHLAEKIPEVAALVNDPMWGNMPSIFKIAQYVGTMMETEAAALNGNVGIKPAERTLVDSISPSLKKQ